HLQIRRRRRHVRVTDLGAALDLELEEVIADLDPVRFLDGDPTLNAGPVHLDAVVAVEVLDDDRPVRLDDASVLAGDVALGQPDRVPLFATDCELVADEGDDDGFSFVVLNNEFVHRRIRHRNPTKTLLFSDRRCQGAGPPSTGLYLALAIEWPPSFWKRFHDERVWKAVR